MYKKNNTLKYLKLILILIVRVVEAATLKNLDLVQWFVSPAFYFHWKIQKVFCRFSRTELAPTRQAYYWQQEHTRM